MVEGLKDKKLAVVNVKSGKDSRKATMTPVFSGSDGVFMLRKYIQSFLKRLESRVLNGQSLPAEQI